MGKRDFCLSCDACNLRWLTRGSVLVSICRCCVFVSEVHPVVTRRALFWMICSFCRLVFDMVGDQMVLAYSMTGRVTAL